MTQTEYVFHYLKTNPYIDTRIAKAKGIERLAARVDNLKKRGVNIETRWKSVPTRWENKTTRVKEYYLAERAAA